MNVLVTGAGGLTGGAVVQSLVAADHRVTALVRSAASGSRLPANVVTMVGDCTNAAAMRDALDGQDVLVHGAGITLGQAIGASEGLRRLRGVVVLSSAGVYSRHRESAAAYRAGEDAILAAFPGAVILRPTMIYGSSRDRNIHHLVAFAARFGFLPLFGSGESLIQPIHYADLAGATAMLVTGGGGGIVDAGGEKPIRLRELLREVFSALGRPPRLIPLPVAAALGAAGLIDRARGSRWHERVERLSEDRSVDISAFVERTGVHPRSFSAGLRTEVEEIRGQAAA